MAARRNSGPNTACSQIEPSEKLASASVLFARKSMVRMNGKARLTTMKAASSPFSQGGTMAVA